MELCVVFFFYGSGRHRDLHSFPTRRSSDTSTVGRAASVSVMSWASESGRAMFPFPEIGRTLVTNTVAGARAMVVRAESYERVPDMGHSRKYSTVSPPCRNKSVRNRPTLAFASSAYAI